VNQSKRDRTGFAPSLPQFGRIPAKYGVIWGLQDLRRRLAAYADYHRDQRNCATHAVGNPFFDIKPDASLQVSSMSFNVESSSS
jgi:hypothetical protein